MGYAPHALLAFGGTFGTKESWSVSLRLHSEGYAAASESARYDWCRAAVDLLVLPVQQFFSGNSAISAAARLNFLKLNPIGPDGRYVSDQTISDTNGGIVLAQGSGSIPPFQLAFAASLRTARLRGVGSKGRIYWPAGISGVDQEGQIGAAAAKNLATYTIGLVHGLNTTTVPGETFHPFVAVVSPGRAGTPTNVPGPTNLVTAVRVGRVPDTQRRRRTKLLEDYQESTYDEVS